MIVWLRNTYQCSECDERWDDEWDCMCNDRCPACDTEMSPIASKDLGRNLQRGDYDWVSRRMVREFSALEAEALVQNSPPS